MLHTPRNVVDLIITYGKGDNHMPRYGSYQDSNIKIVTTEGRNGERVAEANRNINNLRSDILSLKIMVEQGVDPNLITAKIDEIMAKPETFDVVDKQSKPCPKCGRMVLDNGSVPLTGTCLYCGAVVKFPPKLSFGNKEDDTAEQN